MPKGIEFSFLTRESAGGSDSASALRCITMGQIIGSSLGSAALFEGI